jgi:ribosomal protein S21
MGVRIILADSEPIGSALKRFKKKLERQGATWEQRRRGCFVKPTQTRRKKQFQKLFKSRLATLKAKRAGQQPVSSMSEARRRFWEKTGKP